MEYFFSFCSTTFYVFYNENVLNYRKEKKGNVFLPLEIIVKKKTYALRIVFNW